MKPYYADESVTLYLGDCREVLPAVGSLWPDLVVADPPYAETSLRWDRWPTGWVATLADTGAQSMWCFGSARMFDTYREEFAGWRMSQDVIWDKGEASTGMVTDRFLRSHEHIRHYYRGEWGAIHHEAQREHVPWASKGRRVRRPASGKAWHGARGASSWEDDGTRLMLSVQQVPGLRKSAAHPTEKPQPLLDALIRYGCPTGGLLLDPTAGSGSALWAAKRAGRRAVGIEVDERYCDLAARRLAQGVLDFGESA